MNSFILSIDQGTTSSKAIVFNKKTEIIAIAQQEYKQLYPTPSWVEQVPQDIWNSQLSVILEVLKKSGLEAKNIVGMGITNQRETTIVWDKETGEPIYNAIGWQDKRTHTYCNELVKKGYTHFIQKKTGLVIDAYFSATKLKWILDHVPDSRKKAKEGKLAFGTVETWLIWNLTGGKTWVTDVTNASRTMLFNIKDMCWDSDILELFHIPLSILPKIVSCSEIVAQTDKKILGHSIPIAGLAGDQQAALLGQQCRKIGMGKNTYGTGCFLLMNIGKKFITSSSNLLTTIAWKIGEETYYAFEGSVFIAGAAVQWLRDGLGIIENFSDIEEMAGSVKDTNGVYFVPAFTGLGAPYWDRYASGTIIGIHSGVTKEHIARATLEAIAFQTADLVEAMENDRGMKIKNLQVDGGATKNNLLMQIQADILHTDIVRTQETEITALGAAFLAGWATGYWEESRIENSLKKGTLFAPKISANEAENKKQIWKKAVQRSKNWNDE